MLKMFPNHGFSMIIMIQCFRCLRWIPSVCSKKKTSPALKKPGAIDLPATTSFRCATRSWRPGVSSTSWSSGSSTTRRRENFSRGFLAQDMEDGGTGGVPIHQKMLKHAETRTSTCFNMFQHISRNRSGHDEAKKCFTKNIQEFYL